MESLPSQPRGSFRQSPRHSFLGATGSQVLLEPLAISPLQNKVIIAFGVALASIAAIGALQYRTLQRLNEDNLRVSRNQEILRELGAIRSTTNRADAFVQSFVVTGQGDDLAQYSQVVADLHQHLQTLQALNVGNSFQYANAVALEGLANETIRTLQTESNARRTGTLSAEKLLSLESPVRKTIGDQRALTLVMQTAELKALKDWREQAQGTNHQTNQLVLFGAALACGLLCSAGIALYIDLAERGKVERSRINAHAALQRTNLALETQIREKTETELKLQQSERSLRQLSLRLLKTQDEERRHIGRELHDSLGQYLAALNMGLQSLKGSIAPDPAGLRAHEKLSECSNLTAESLREVRTMSYLLHPPLLEECGLSSAIPSYLQGFSKRSGIQVTLDISPGFGRLPEDVELALFRVLQESLTNVHRHSGSRTAHVRALMHDGLVTIEISDHGSGLSVESRSDLSGMSGVGLKGMMERMRQFGGSLEIDSSDAGTTIRAIAPHTSPKSAKAASA